MTSSCGGSGGKTRSRFRSPVATTLRQLTKTRTRLQAVQPSHEALRLAHSAADLVGPSHRLSAGKPVPRLSHPVQQRHHREDAEE